MRGDAVVDGMLLFIDFLVKLVHNFLHPQVFRQPSFRRLMWLLRENIPWQEIAATSLSDIMICDVSWHIFKSLSFELASRLSTVALQLILTKDFIAMSPIFVCLHNTASIDQFSRWIFMLLTYREILAPFSSLRRFRIWVGKAVAGFLETFVQRW